MSVGFLFPSSPSNGAQEETASAPTRQRACMSTFQFQVLVPRARAACRPGPPAPPARPGAGWRAEPAGEEAKFARASLPTAASCSADFDGSSLA